MSHRTTCLLVSILVAFALSACDSAQDLNAGFYRDINLFTLEGEGRFQSSDSVTYPNFYIVTENPHKKKVIVNYSKSNRSISEYSKNDQYWYNETSFYADSERIYHSYVFTFVFDDKVIKLKYGYNLPGVEKEYDSDTLKRPVNYDSTHHHLDEVVILSKIQRVSYSFYHVSDTAVFLKIKPSLQLAENVEKLPYDSKSEEYFYENKDTLLIRRVADVDNTTTVDTTYYPLKDQFGFLHNAWWITVFQMGDKIE